MITFKHKDIILDFTPLENGNNEYVVNLHDHGNLESVVNRCVDGYHLNQLIDLINSYNYYILGCDRWSAFTL